MREVREKKNLNEFLPFAYPRSAYLETYRQLAQELKDLPTSQTHSLFFYEYAQHLLIAIEEFIREPSWEGTPIGRLSNGKPHAYDANPYEAPNVRKFFDYVRHERELNPRLDGLLKTPRAQMFDVFRSELAQVARERRANYEWFILFSSRLSYLTQPEAYKCKSDLDINTAYTLFTSVVDCTEVWKSERLFRDLQVHFLDRFTREMSTPLALVDTFPHYVMIPYPFELNVEELVSLHPTEEVNLFPLGFSFRPIVADGSLHTPAEFFMHDVQHLATWRTGYSTVASKKKLDDEQIRAIFPYLKKVKSLFSQFYSQVRHEVAKVKDDYERSLYSFILYIYGHENRILLPHRTAALFLQKEIEPHIASYHIRETGLKLKASLPFEQMKEIQRARVRFDDLLNRIEPNILNELKDTMGFGVYPGLKGLKTSVPISLSYRFYFPGYSFVDSDESANVSYLTVDPLMLVSSAFTRFFSAYDSKFRDPMYVYYYPELDGLDEPKTVWGNLLVHPECVDRVCDLGLK